MALHSFNIKYRYNFIPLYNLTSLVFYFSLFISCVCFFLNRYDFMIHFGLSTYTFPRPSLLPRTLAHVTHTSQHAITATTFTKTIKLNV